MFIASTKHVDASPITNSAIWKRQNKEQYAAIMEARMQREKEEKAEAARIAAEEKKQRDIEMCVSMLRSEALRDDRYIGKKILEAVNAGYTLNSIGQRVCLVFGVTLEELQSTSRLRRFILPRACFSFYAKTEGKRSYTQIARFLKRDHTTIMHAHRNYLNIKARAKADRDRKAKA